MFPKQPCLISTKSVGDLRAGKVAPGTTRCAQNGLRGSPRYGLQGSRKPVRLRCSDKLTSRLSQSILVTDSTTSRSWNASTAMHAPLPSQQKQRPHRLLIEIARRDASVSLTRYDSLSIGGNKEARDLHQRLGEAQVRHGRNSRSTEKPNLHCRKFVTPTPGSSKLV